MTRGRRKGVLIAGGGLAGSLAALAMASLRPEVPLLIVDERERFGGDRLWLVFDAEIPDEARSFVEPLIARSWEGFYLAFPRAPRKLKAPLHAITGEALDAELRRALDPDRYRLGTRVVAVRDDALVLDGGETIRAEGAIDARGPANLSMLNLQHLAFLRRDYRFDAPHGVDRPVLADATLNQGEGLAFFRCVPLGETRLAVYHVVLSSGPRTDPEAAGKRLDDYVERRGWSREAVEREDLGDWPLPAGGDFDAFWRIGGARVAKLGLRGGFFHPGTGWTAGDAIRAALSLAAQPDFTGAALHDTFEAEAKSLWADREVYRAFNATLARSGPGGRRARFERLHRIDPGVLTRFYADRLRLLDRRVLERELRG